MDLFLLRRYVDPSSESDEESSRGGRRGGGYGGASRNARTPRGRAAVGAAMANDSGVETVERILDYRIGRKGGIVLIVFSLPDD